MPLCMQGVGERIAVRRVPKIFLLNGSHDRETSAGRGSEGGPMSALDVVLAVCDALNRHHGKARHPIILYCACVIMHLLYSLVYPRLVSLYNSLQPYTTGPLQLGYSGTFSGLEERCSLSSCH